MLGLTFEGDMSESEVLDSTLAKFGLVERLPDGKCLVETVVGCNCSFRKSAILAAGMSDERFTGSGWGEDTDLACALPTTDTN